MSLLRGRRLLVVTGKGGVGRTTVTAALGLAAAQAGLRTVVVELSGQDRLASVFGRSPRYAPQPVAPGLDLRSLTAPACVADFAERKLRVPSLLRWVFENRLMTGFVDAVPGLHDLVQLGKIENMLFEPLEGEPQWDLCVLDGPATGHGLTLLSGARALQEATAAGPFHDLAEIIAGLLSRPADTSVVLVTLPELLPVHESVELAAALAADAMPVSAVVCNRVPPTWPAQPALDAVLAALPNTPGGDLLRSLAEHAAAQAARADVALDALSRGGLTAPRRSLPDLPHPTLADLATPLVPWFAEESP